MKDPVLERVIREQGALEDARADLMRQRSANSQQLGEIGGWTLHLVDLGVQNFGAARSTPAVIDASGYGVQILQGGSDRVAASIDASDGGTYGPVYPGWGVRMKRRFGRLRLKAWESDNVPKAGTYTLPGSWAWGRYLVIAVARVPDAEWLEPGAVGGGFCWARYTTSQLYNATTNLPTSANDGIDVRGATSVMCGVATNGGTGLILGGTVVWWKDPTRLGSAFGAWGETDVQQPLVTGRAVCWLSELEVHNSDGRLFPELRSFTTDFGSGPPNIYMVAFGTGGELTLPGQRP